MNLRQLRYFMAIVESGSLSAAAHKIGVAQPSLSQHLANMEQELGVRLMDRSPRGSLVTAEGEVLLRYATDICASLDRCVSEIRDLAPVVQGSVRFGMPPSVSMVMSVPLAETVRSELPGVRLRASEAMSGFIKTWIEEETVDIGFLYDLEGVKHLRATPVLEEKVYLFSAPDAWPLPTPPGTPARLADLAHLELVMPGRPHGLRRIVDAAAARCGVELNVVTELDAMTQIKELVARGSGHTLFAPAAAHDFVEAGKLVKTLVVEPEIRRPVYLVRPRRCAQTRACAEVERVTLAVARDIVRRGIWEGELTATA